MFQTFALSYVHTSRVVNTGKFSWVPGHRNVILMKCGVSSIDMHNHSFVGIFCGLICDLP